MPQREELKLVDSGDTSLEEDAFVFVADKQTGQMSFEPLENISLDIIGEELSYFSATSLGRRVNGFFVEDRDGIKSGEIDFVMPLSAGDTEQF